MPVTRKRIALYGGAFDPPHNGHIATIALLLNAKACDEVIVLPSGDRPDKSYGACAQDRLELTRAALDHSFNGNSSVILSEEHVRGEIGYGTIDIVEHFTKRSPQSELFVVIGTELMKDLPMWKASERLKQEAAFIVVERPGAVAAELPAGWRCVRLSQPHETGVLVSSTTLRAMISNGALCAGLMPLPVITLCKQKRLYGSK